MALKLGRDKAAGGEKRIEGLKKVNAGFGGPARQSLWRYFWLLGGSAAACSFPGWCERPSILDMPSKTAPSRIS